ncbi:hypothetical protein [Allorhizocola rhizosphaerae]|uniref:hypothetical protein n=1 Tax=Allorhizocola rhizosphaerae TaxID=1872709 RepID=UPI000E3D5AF3|nr:hypothetical protein [Allorhizocola rhizosphaerae]
MSDDEMTPDQRLQRLARASLAGYKSSTVSLRRLIDDLDAVWNNLPSTDWSEEVRGHWWTLEQVYAVALDRGELEALPADAKADIEEAVRALEALLDSWPLRPDTVA